MSGSFDKYIDAQFKSNSESAAEIDQYAAYIDLAMRLYELRKKAGLSQRRLAELLGTSQANIARWETPGYTNYTLKSLEKLARFFGVTLQIDLREAESTSMIKNKAYEMRPHYIHMHTGRFIAYGGSETMPVVSNDWSIKHV
jgi:transcriptional regulator with XRE-family HTH domain